MSGVTADPKELFSGECALLYIHEEPYWCIYCLDWGIVGSRKQLNKSITFFSFFFYRRYMRNMIVAGKALLVWESIAVSCFVLFSVVINRTLPNVATFVRLVLKREKLSEEAESLRAKYEESLNALEQGRLPPRPISFNGDDDSGYFSGNRPRGMYGELLAYTFCFTKQSICSVTSQNLDWKTLLCFIRPGLPFTRSWFNLLVQYPCMHTNLFLVGELRVGKMRRSCMQLCQG